MIIIGYQGIGKSTLSNNNIKYIDLESGNFWIDGIRIHNWYRIYSNIANHLSKQGKNVFISSHKVVREELKNMCNEKICVIYPSIQLKDEWIKKLEDRYNKTNLDKDYKALINAKEMYEENINELSKEDSFYRIEIDNIEYDLKELLEETL